MAQTLVFDTEANSYQSIPSDLAPNVFANPRYHVPLNDPNGDLVTTTYGNAQTLLAQDIGYTQPSQAQLYSLLQSSIYNTPEQRIKGFGEQLTKNLFPLGAGTKALVTLGDKPENIRTREMFQPGWLKFAGEMAGLVGSEFIPGGQAQVMEKLGLGGLKLFGMGVKPGEILSMGQRMSRGAIKEALEFGLLESGNAIHNMIIQDPSASAQSAIAHLGESILEGAALGSLFGAAKPLVLAPFKTAKDAILETNLNKIKLDSDPDKLANEVQLAPMFKKLLKVVGGPSIEDQEKLLRYNDVINAENAETFEQVYDFVSDHVKKLDSDVLSKKTSVEEYKQKIKELQKEIKKEISKTIDDKDAAYLRADNLYHQAKADSLKIIKADALAQDKIIDDAMAEIGTKAFNASQEALDVLVNANKTVNIEPLLKSLDDQIALRRSQESPFAQTLADYIEQHAERIKQAGTDIPAERAKRILQGIGQEGFKKGVKDPFQTELSSFYSSLYHDFSEYLKKEFPEYATKIKPSADLMEILNELKDKGYRDVESIRSKLNNLIIKDGINAPPQIELLTKLEKESSQKFMDQINSYVNMTKNKEFKNLREYQALMLDAETSAVFEEIKKKIDIKNVLENTENIQLYEKAINELDLQPEAKQYLKDIIKNTNYFESNAEARKANEELAAAIAKREELKGLSTENVQSWLRRAMKGKEIKIERVLEKLPQLNEKELQSVLQAIHTREQFEKGFMHGSRNTLGWKTIFSTLLGAKFGGLLGAGAGMYVDRYGPQITKDILDKYVTMFGDLASEAGAKDPSMLRIMLYKFLSGGAPVNVQGFKAGLKYLEAVGRTQKTIASKINYAFDDSAKIALLDSLEENKKREAFTKKVAKIDVEKIIEGDNPIAYYMPDHGSSIVSVMANVGNYLRTKYPQGITLNGKRVISSVDQAKFDRTVDIARSPLVILDHFKRGNLLPTDLEDLNAMYPSVLNQIQSQLLEKVMDMTLKNEPMTETQKIGLSLIFNNPIRPATPMIPGMPIQSKKVVPFGAMKNLKKLPMLEQTLGQKAESQ